MIIIVRLVRLDIGLFRSCCQSGTLYGTYRGGTTEAGEYTHNGKGWPTRPLRDLPTHGNRPCRGGPEREFR